MRAGKLRLGDSHITRGSPAVWVVAWTLGGAAMCVLYQPTRLPLLADSQHYFFIAERAASGTPPHVSHFDPKNALASLVTAGAIVAGRELGASDVAATRVASIAATGACAGLTWLLAWLLTGRALTAHLAAGAMATFDDFLLMGAIGAQPKTFVTLALTIFLVLAFRRRPFTTGVAAAAAFLSWQPAAMLWAAAAAPLLLERGRVRGLSSLVAGFAGATLAYEAYFWWHGALGVQLLQAYSFPLRYMGGIWPPKISGLLQHTAWILRFKNGPTAASVVPLCAAIALVLAWVFALVRTRPVLGWLRRERGALTFVVALHLMLAFVLWNYQGFPDRFVLLPFIAVAAAVLWAAPLVSTGDSRDAVSLRATGSASRPARTSTIVIAATAVAVAIGLGGPPAMRLARARLTHTLAEQEQLARDVEDMLVSGQSVWAVGCTHLLALNHANNFVNYGFFFRGLPTYLRDESGGRFEPRSRGALPDVVLTSRRSPAVLEQWLARNYVEVAARPFRQQGIQVWRIGSRAIRGNRGHRARR